VLKSIYLQKALAIVDSELDLLHLKIQYPDQFLQVEQSVFESDLYIRGCVRTGTSSFSFAL